jgi:hypothetical protein
MTPIHKLQNGDVLKILPIYKKDGGFELFKNVECAWIGNKMIYDDSGKGYLSRMFFNNRRKNPTSRDITLTRRNFLSVYINGGIKFVSVTQRLLDIIMDGISHYDVNDNSHLLIVSEIKSGFTDYSGSKIIQRNWVKPILGFDEKNEWKEWILSNQPCYLEDIISKMNVANNLQTIKNVLGNENILSDLISEYRDEKINKIFS